MSTRPNRGKKAHQIKGPRRKEGNKVKKEAEKVRSLIDKLPSDKEGQDGTKTASTESPPGAP